MFYTKLKNGGLSRAVPYLLLFVLSFCLCMIFVPVFDDLFFLQINDGSIQTAWQNAVRYGNGRYLGNFICFFIIQYPVLTALVKSVSLVLLVFLIQKCFGFHGRGFVLLTSAAVVFVTPKMIGEAFAWTAAFVNYVPPVILFLVCLYGLRVLSDVSRRPSTAARAGWTAAVVVLGFCAQLFSENTAAVCVFFAFLAAVFSIKEKRTCRVAALLWFFASAAGFLVLLFGTRLIQPDEGFIMRVAYKGSVFSNLLSAETVKTVVKNLLIFENSVGSNVFLFVLMSAVFLIAFSSNAQAIQKRAGQWKWIKAVLLIYPCFSALSLFLSFQPISNSLFRTAVNAVNLAMLFLYGLAVVIGIFCFVQNRQIKTDLLLWCLLAVASAGILLVVTPIATRCFYLTVCLLSIVALKGAWYYRSEIKKQLTAKRCLKGVQTALRLAFAAFFAVLVLVYTDIRFVDTVREEYVQTQLTAGATTICAPDLPHENFVVEAGADCGVYAATHYREKSGDVVYQSIDTQDWMDSFYYSEDSDSLENKLNRIYKIY